MTNYIIKRSLIGLLILFLVLMGVFLLMHLLPGNPLYSYIGAAELDFLTPEALAELERQYGLDRPLVVQYYSWLKGLLRGDLGYSIVAHAEITELAAQTLPRTVYINIQALILGTVVGVLFGTICALRRGGWLDNVLTLIANIGITIPGFWLGIVLLYIFALNLGWFPVGGFTSPFVDFWDSTRRLVLPVFCLSVGSVAGLTRLTRSSMLEVVRQDYIRTAWSKGLTERVIVSRHALKNAFIPIITVLGMQIGHILGGSVIIETVFNIPGMGRLITSSIFSQDYQVVQAGVILLGGMMILANLITDISYGWFDPRIRYSK